MTVKCSGVLSVGGEIYTLCFNVFPSRKSRRRLGQPEKIIKANIYRRRWNIFILNWSIDKEIILCHFPGDKGEEYK